MTEGWLPVNTFTGGVPPLRQLNPQLLTATLLVGAVRSDVQSLVPLALQQGAATVVETRIREWQTALQSAVSLVSRIPAPLIFPPPAFVVFANSAVNQINQVLTTLAGIPSASPRIFPPQPGQATISLETLLFILNDLQQAEVLLTRALQAA